MKILVLDTIHGGTVIGSAFESAGCTVDMVDVYRNSTRVNTAAALTESYDLVIAPAHLDPDHPLIRSQKVPVITHHEAVRMLLADAIPHPMIEITGAQGKTTTAHALASLMKGRGVLLSSRGLILFPEQESSMRLSITPASVIPAAHTAGGCDGWLIAEESLGITGAGDLAILTSGQTYRFAAGKRDALEQKIRMLRSCRRILLAPGIACDLPEAVRVDEAAEVDRTRCKITTGQEEGSFENRLLAEEAYRVPLMLAGTAACMLGLDPSPLSGFCGVEGRMAVRKTGGIVIVDNANSGTNRDTTIAAAGLARNESGCDALTLVIGSVEGEGKVCEGFPDTEIADAIRRIRPSRLILVGDVLDPPLIPPDAVAGTFISRAPTLGAAREAAICATDHGSIVLAVKTWR